MTSPEKTEEQIEELLQTFGVTLKDMPKPDNGYAAYSMDDLHDAYHRAINWREKPHKEGWLLEDFICHQSDVIWKLVNALEIEQKLLSLIHECAQYISDKSRPYEDVLEKEEEK